IPPRAALRAAALPGGGNRVAAARIGGASGDDGRRFRLRARRVLQRQHLLQFAGPGGARTQRRHARVLDRLRVDVRAARPPVGEPLVGGAVARASASAWAPYAVAGGVVLLSILAQEAVLRISPTRGAGEAAEDAMAQKNAAPFDAAIEPSRQSQE